MTETVLGYCKECGIAVTEKNEGVLEPKVLCARCYQEELDRQEAEARAVIEEENRKVRDEEMTRSRMRSKRNLSMIVGGIVALVVLASMIIYGIKNDSLASKWVYIVVGSYLAFTFTASMFFEGVVRDIVEYMCSKSIHFPGLIFTLDLDGILWLISVKILFAIIGFFAGILFSVLGIVAGFLVSGITYPFSLLHQNRCIRKADEIDFD